MQDRAACSWTLRPARVMSPDSISRRLHIIAILKFVELWKDNERSLSRSFRRHHDSRFIIVSRGEFLSFFSCFFELFEIVNVNLFRRYNLEGLERILSEGLINLPLFSSIVRMSTEFHRYSRIILKGIAPKIQLSYGFEDFFSNFL